METIDHIPTSKIQRATKIISTGAKVGVNYAKFYTSKLVSSSEDAKKKLDERNAHDIYDSLKNLKGGALKVAQMLSMDKSILPEAYVEKFSLSQFQVPPLSPALVTRTFKKYFGKSPYEIFDTFTAESVNAASIGQVHKAEKNGKKLAVKIQYPGVAESIGTDLALVKPFAIKMFNLQGEGSDQYFEEVRDKLLEETNYLLEVEQSKMISEACSHMPNVRFPEYYSELSSDRIITMDWMDGEHISTFAKTNQDPVLANKLGQAMWDFYMFQIHNLKMVHADPHPGNFLISKAGELIIIDFGCVKKIPNDFYQPYFELIDPRFLQNDKLFTEKLYQLEILRKDDSAQEIAFFKTMFNELLELFTRPLVSDSFDFTDQSYFASLAEVGERYAKGTELRKMNGNRGSRHFIYMNRTFFGLYHLMNELGASGIKINNLRKAA
jgi:predicted unusual protein kinase regulating ubiquinone biosynthesis (AarF/ABC1/UbiB family)